MALPSPSIPLAWPITATTLSSELTCMHEVVTRWKERFADEAFLRQLDSASELDRAELFGQFINEMKVCASKAATLVEVMA